jgi:hypothetical protein
MSLERKKEIQKRMAELQQEFATLNNEKKTIEIEEQAVAARAKYADYKFKVGLYGYKLYEESEIKEVSDSDREDAKIGSSGLAYSGADSKDGFCYILLKNREDHSRVKRVLVLLEAAHQLANEKERDKEKYIKILLGETNGEDPVQGN